MFRVPAVRVYLQDKSYVREEPLIGRSVLLCVISDRGEHNRVVPINSVDQFIAEYGRPNLERYGQAHFFATNILRYTNRVYVIRPAITKSPIPDHNCTYSNAIIRTNISDDFDIRIYGGRYVFTNQTDAVNQFGEPIVSKFVFCNYIAYEETDIGEMIFNYGDDYTFARRVIAKTRIPNIGTNTAEYIYRLELDDFYQGSSTVNTDNQNSLLVTLTSQNADPSLIDSYILPTNYKNYALNAYEYRNPNQLVSYNYTFTQNSNIVVCENQAAYNAVRFGKWIYPVNGNVYNSYQVVDKRVQNNQYQLVIHRPASINYTGNVYIRALIELSYQRFAMSEKDFDSPYANNIFTFYGKGVGSYYNTISLQAIRNTTMEKVYVDEFGEPIYKYAFLDLFIYGQNPDGTRTLLEGPWTCSLMNNIGGEPVRDIFTGRELFLPKVINSQSRYIRCKENQGAFFLEGATPEAELLRLQVLSLFSENYVKDTTVRGIDGFFLQNGGDGNQFDRWGRLRLDNQELISAIAMAYEGSLESEDGSIGLLRNTLFPTYDLDYVCTGGYPVVVHNAARNLVDERYDCMLICDTGANFTRPSEDLAVRRTSMSWNSPNTMIYTQYREIHDVYSARKFYISPAYHAIENHLKVDRDLFLSHPVAGIANASIHNAIRYAYYPSEVEIENLISNELNPVIYEPDGSYIITQFTTYKAHSILKRGHAMKFIHYVRKAVKKLLKDLVQRLATPYWISVAEQRVNSFLLEYNNPESRLYSISSYNVSVRFDEEKSQMEVYISLKLLRSIENIDVYIAVQ